MNSLNRQPFRFQQMDTIVPTRVNLTNNKMVDLYQFYSSARQQIPLKENSNTSNIKAPDTSKSNIVSKSATSSTTNFCKEELITRIKKLNQIRQKSQQNVQPLHKKYSNIKNTLVSTTTTTEPQQISHQRYRSTTQQKASTAVSFQQLLQKTTDRINITQRYENKQDIIYEEPSPFVKDVEHQRSIVPYYNLLHIQSVTRSKPTDFLSKISNIAGLLQRTDKSYLTTNQRDRSHTSSSQQVNEVKKSLDNMCRLSSQQLNLMHQTRKDLTTNYNSSDSQAQTITLDLTCDEEVKFDAVETTVVVDVPHEELEMPGNYCQETLKFLVMREREYLPDPHYLAKEQVNLTWQMRAILIDWMMDVSCEFHLKRDTLHLAVSYLDSYLSRSASIPKLRLQLVGLTTLFLAAKIEEILPRKVQDFARAADYGYQIDEILEMELKILCCQKWMVNPPTVTLWTNWYITQWDLYVAAHPQQVQCYFKRATEESYQLFCQVIQLIDCAVLDVQFLQYPQRTIIASFMYLTLTVAHGVFHKNDIKNIKHSSLFLLDCSNQFNLYFGQFVMFSFGFQLLDLLPAIQFASTFFSLPISFDTPPGVQSLARTPLEGHYEEFLSFQMHSRDSLTFVKERPRNDL